MVEGSTFTTTTSRRIPPEARAKNYTSPDLPGGAGAIRHLETKAKAADFVILKVDIDGGPELQVVEAVLDRTLLVAAVHSLFRCLWIGTADALQKA